MNQKNTQPLSGPATRYRIEMRGRLNVDWLQYFDRAAEITVDGLVQLDDIVVLYLHADPSRIVGLVHRLRGLRMAILQIKIVSDRRQALESE